MHELATNAAKHGSLSVSSGTVGVSWTADTRNNPRRLRLVWEERGGPSPGEPKAGGFGSTLIDSVIPGAHVEREFRPAGLVCTIEVELPEKSEDGAGV
jgi:two-component system CheB/CheR fusion protein